MHDFFHMSDLKVAARETSHGKDTVNFFLISLNFKMKETFSGFLKTNEHWLINDCGNCKNTVVNNRKIYVNLELRTHKLNYEYIFDFLILRRYDSLSEKILSKC